MTIHQVEKTSQSPDSKTHSKTGSDAASTTVLARPAPDMVDPGNTRACFLALEAMDEQ